MTLNTLKIAKRMEEAGMPRPQCEALATALNDEVSSNLVTNSAKCHAPGREHGGRRIANVETEGLPGANVIPNRDRAAVIVHVHDVAHEKIATVERLFIF